MATLFSMVQTVFSLTVPPVVDHDTTTRLERERSRLFDTIGPDQSQNYRSNDCYLTSLRNKRVAGTQPHGGNEFSFDTTATTTTTAAVPSHRRSGEGSFADN